MRLGSTAVSNVLVPRKVAVFFTSWLPPTVRAYMRTFLSIITLLELGQSGGEYCTAAAKSQIRCQNR